MTVLVLLGHCKPVLLVLPVHCKLVPLVLLVRHNYRMMNRRRVVRSNLLEIEENVERLWTMFFHRYEPKEYWAVARDASMRLRNSFK